MKYILENFWFLKFSEGWLVSKNICTRKLQIWNCVYTKISQFTALNICSHLLKLLRWLQESRWLQDRRWLQEKPRSKCSDNAWWQDRHFEGLSLCLLAILFYISHHRVGPWIPYIGIFSLWKMFRWSPSTTKIKSVKYFLQQINRCVLCNQEVHVLLYFFVRDGAGSKRQPVHEV